MKLASKSLVAFLASLQLAVVCAEQPLRDRIDSRMAEVHPGPEIPLCSDGEYLRRVYLDFVGTIPSGDQAREFITDRSPDKREKIVDRLLSDPAHAKHMAQVFDVMLMERRVDKHIKADQWKTYLLASFQQNKPLNELAREMLAADGVDDAQRGPAKFYLEREVEPNLITREVGRMFFGMDLQCAQCHDHPAIEDYHQSDYYGLFAFVNRSYLFQPDKKKPAVLAEKAEGDAKFKSVFTEEEGSTRPRLPGDVEIDEPSFAKEEAYQVKPDPKKKDVRPIPKYSRRQELARRATDGSNRVFNRNVANRLWAHMLGRGLVHPVDQHHSDNPPVHPELLDLLADELPKIGFDVRSMLRELALSRTYQRSIDLPQDFAQHARSATEQLNHWKQRQDKFAKAVEESLARIEQIQQQLKEKKETLPPLLEAEKKAGEALVAAKKGADDATKSLSDRQQKLKEKRAIVQLLADAATKTGEAVAVLAEDQELGKALSTLQARQKTLSAAAAEDSKGLAALQAEHQTAATKLSEAQRVSDESEKNLASATGAIDSLKKTLAQSTQKQRSDRTIASHAALQVARVQTAASFGESLQRRDTLTEETRQLNVGIAAAKEQLDKLSPQLETLKRTLPESESALATAAAESSTATSQLESTRQAAGLVAASLEKVTEAAQKLSDDAELNAVAATLQTRSQALTAKVDSLAKVATEADSRRKELESKVASVRQTVKETEQKLAAVTQTSKTLQVQLAEKSRLLAENAQRVERQRDALTAAWSKQFSIAVVQPLTPEQLGWSMLHATGYTQRQRASVRAALDKKSPLKPEEAKDQAKLDAREKEIDKQTEAKLAAIVGRFVKLYGAAAGQPQDDFFATVEQALFMGNGGELRSWLTPTGGNLTDRLLQTDDTKRLAEDLYLSILTRFPTDAESEEVAKYLSLPETDKRNAVQEMAWALLTSTEFRFQH